MSKYPPASNSPRSPRSSGNAPESPPSTFNILPARFNEPLGAQYCLYFSLLSQISLISGVATLFALFYAIYKRDSRSYVSLVSMTGLYVLGYFTNRLMNSMCMGSLV